MDKKAASGAPIASNPLLRNSQVCSDMLDIREAWKRGEFTRQSPDPSTKGTPLKLKNNSGATRSRGDILKIGDSTLASTSLQNKQLWHDGDTPDGSTEFAVLIQPAASGKYAQAVTSGVVTARVDIDDLSHTHANQVSTSYQLASGESGPVRILDNPSGATGVQKCVVLLGDTAGDTHWQFTLTENMGATTSNQASATKLTIDGTSTGDTIAVLDATPNSMWENLESGDSGWCFERGGEYHILYSEGVGSGDTIWQFTLTENMGATTTDEGAASKLNADGSDASESITVLDGSPNSIFSVLTSGSSGWCFEQGGSYYIIQAECADSSGSDTSGYGPFYQAFNVF